MLRVVNPGVRYSTKVSASPEEGVAVILKEFLQALECRGIQHNSEKELRKLFRKQPRCATSKKQFFLTKKSKEISLRRGHDTRCVSCICLPQDYVPVEFFEIMRGIY